MSKLSITGIEARNKAIKGMSYVATAVKNSIGPFGLNHLSEKGNKISNDGAFIAEHLCPTIENEFERRGALCVNESVTRINDEVGDASSTAWALHEAIIKEALRYLPTETTIKAKKTYSEIAQMLDKSCKEVVAELEKIKTPIASKEELIKSALVSSEDEKIAEFLGSMQWDLGENGRIIAEEVNDTECSIEKVDGIIMDNGFTSSNLVTNPETQTLEIKTSLPIILTNYVIGVPEMKILRDNIFKTLATQKKTGCIVMARAFTGDAIKEAQENMSTFATLMINAPYTDQREVMKDIQAVVGGRYIDNEETRLDDIYITDVGYCNRIVARRFNSIISGIVDEEYKKRVDERIDYLKKSIIGSQSEFEKRLLSERVAQLEGGFAILKVGSKSLTDRKRLKDKADDAVNSVRLALKGGTVKGAGLAFKEISDKMEEGNILKRPITCIYDQIITSAPEDYVIPEWVRDPYLVLKTVLERTCAFVPTFSSINSIDTTANPKECVCGKNTCESGE